MDYDKILVLDEGKVVEYFLTFSLLTNYRFDTPFGLLEKKGIFHGMVAESGEYNALMEIAKNGKQN